MMQQSPLYDYIILGAGPAGLQLAYYLAQRGRQYLVLEAGAQAGSFFQQFPRHGQLISINKVHTGTTHPERNLRWDWNALLCDDHMPFKTYSTDYFPRRETMLQYLQDFATNFHLNIAYNARVQTISRDGAFQLVDTHGRRYRCHRLIVATGVSQPYIPAIPGIEHAECYSDVSVQAEDFVNQRVFILGKGNSAFETADNLVGTAALIHLASPHPVRMAWESHHAGHLRAVNNNLLDTYQLKAQNALLNATIERIEYAHGRYTVTVAYTHTAQEREALPYDRVIVCTGFRFDATMFDATCRPQLTLNERFPQQTSAWESVNVPDLYFAGTLMQERDYKKSSSAFIHGFRYNVRALFHMLDTTYHAGTWPGEHLDCTSAALVDYVLGRVNTTSALWQQFGFLCDVLVVDAQKAAVQCYTELPVAYVHEGPLGQQPWYYTLTLEYGSAHAENPFSINRPHSKEVCINYFPIVLDELYNSS